MRWASHITSSSVSSGMAIRLICFVHRLLGWFGWWWLASHITNSSISSRMATRLYVLPCVCGLWSVWSLCAFVACDCSAVVFCCCVACCFVLVAVWWLCFSLRLLGGCVVCFFALLACSGLCAGAGGDARRACAGAGGDARRAGFAVVSFRHPVVYMHNRHNHISEQSNQCRNRKEHQPRRAKRRPKVL